MYFEICLEVLQFLKGIYIQPGPIFFGKPHYVSSRLVTNRQRRLRAKLATAVFRNYVFADIANKGDYTLLLV